DCPGGTVSATGGGGSVSLSGASLTEGAACTVTVTVTSSTPGGHQNTIPVNTVTTGQSVSNTTAASATLTVTAAADLSITKSDSPDPVAVNGTLTYTLSVTNNGPSTATSVSVTDTLPGGVTYVSASGTGWTCSELTGVVTCTRATLGVGAAPAITVTVTAPGTAGTITNTVSVSAATTDPVPGNNSDSEDTGVQDIVVTDPAVTKTGDPSTAAVGDTVVFTIVVENLGNNPATTVRVLDTVPAFLTVLNVAAPGGANSSSGNTVDVTYGTVNPIDVFTITVTTVVNSSPTPPTQTNTVTLTADADDNDSNNISSTTITIVDPGLQAPETGFAPGQVTQLPAQPRDAEYASLGELWLEIPSLGVQTTIVGVPQTGRGWDVTWLGQDAGYLNGTAFPTWQGNSVITAHVTLSTGLEGPFADLKDLRFGDTVIVHGWGEQYVFQIQEMELVSPFDRSIFRHEERSWLTLVTCHGFDERENTYRWRVAARAVLTSVEADGSVPAPAYAPPLTPPREDPPPRRTIGH
ncbi:MAG TPA: sortase, partial [Anaerolineales bacterium]|nr:sortase [Anaerolineales bacterium]